MRAARLSVITRSPGARGVFEGAITSHAIPAPANQRFGS